MIMKNTPSHSFVFIVFVLLTSLTVICCNPKIPGGLRANDLNKDVEIVTDKGTMVVRLSDSTPLHRDNFLRLVKEKYFDSVLFHRVINRFMIQSGDPDSKHAKPGAELGNGGPTYQIPAEFRASLFHYKGVIAAAREGDGVYHRTRAVREFCKAQSNRKCMATHWIKVAAAIS